MLYFSFLLLHLSILVLYFLYFEIGYFSSCSFLFLTFFSCLLFYLVSSFSHPPSIPFFISFFYFILLFIYLFILVALGSCKLFTQGWLCTMILLISVSWVARITGISHQHLAHSFIFTFTFLKFNIIVYST
jgi:hypothetical protein